MVLVKSLWAMMRGDPVFMMRLNAWLTWFWIVMIPVSIWTGWINSVAYVSALSLWALVSGHWAAYQAARVEVRQERQEKQRDEEDLPGAVLDRLIRHTTVDPVDPPPE